MRRHELSETAWRRLAPPLAPERPRRGGRPPSDRRRAINGIPWVLGTGSPWRDPPERHGPWSGVASSFYRRRAEGTWGRVLAGPQRDADARGRLDWTLHAVDSTVIRAHRHAAPESGTGVGFARRAGAVGG